ncbi:MAG: hypothetical protein WD844_14610 [Thermoleophilaceae bacterium]
MAPRLALVLAAAALTLPGCGGDDRDAAAGDLVWTKDPLVFAPETLPDDRVLSGELRNDSLRRVELAAEDLRLVSADGDEVDGSAVFLDTYAHQLFPPTREPEGGIPEQELLRLGVKARIEPGETAPLTISWRQPSGAERPVRVDTGLGSLPVP